MNSQIWKRQIPLKLTFNKKSIYLNLPSQNYLFIALDKQINDAIKEVQKSSQSKPEENSDEKSKNLLLPVFCLPNGVFVKWHFPVGVIYDMFMMFCEKGLERESDILHWGRFF